MNSLPSEPTAKRDAGRGPHNLDIPPADRWTGGRQMNDPVVLAVVAVAAIVAFVVGFFARSLWASQAFASRRTRRRASSPRLELSRRSSSCRRRTSRCACSASSTRKAAPSAASFPALERRLLQRDEQLDQRTDMLEERDRKLLGRERELDVTKEELAKARQEQIAALERVSGLSQRGRQGLAARGGPRTTPSTTPSGSPAPSSARRARTPRRRRATSS